MPWTADSFKSKHNKGLRKVEAQRAADIANAILEKTGDEGKAIRIANSKVRKSNYDTHR
jgi:uncharacterized protein YdaT